MVWPSLRSVSTMLSVPFVSSKPIQTHIVGPLILAPSTRQPSNPMSAVPQGCTVITAPSGKVTGPSVGSGVELGGSEAGSVGAVDGGTLGATLAAMVGVGDASPT